MSTGPETSAAPERRTILGAVWRGSRSTIAAPFSVFPTAQILANARLIRALAVQVRWPPHLAEPGVLRNDDGLVDLQATSLTFGVSPPDLVARMAARRRQSATLAYASFALGWCFFALWFYRGVSSGFHGSRAFAMIEFIPFCAIFFLVAFQYAHQNWQLRTGLAGSVGDYIRSSEPFWPS